MVTTTKQCLLVLTATIASIVTGADPDKSRNLKNVKSERKFEARNMSLKSCGFLVFILYLCGFKSTETATIYKNCEYHVVDGPRVNFKEANSKCREMGGSLAMLKSNSIQDFVEGIISQKYKGRVVVEYWLGAEKLENDFWYWLDGTLILKNDSTWFNPNEYSAIYTNKLILSSWKTTLDTMKWFTKPGTYDIKYICEVPTIDACKSIQCQNNRTCVVIGCSKITNCECISGYTGRFCEEDIFTISSDIHNITTLRGQNISLTLKINGYNDRVRIEVFKNSMTSSKIVTYTDIRNSVDIVIGPLTDLTIGRKYWFRATPMDKQDSYYKSMYIDVVVQGLSKIKRITPRILALPNSSQTSTINCTTTGVPIPTIHWLKGERLITNNSSKNIYQICQPGQALLFVKNDSRKNFGNYTCHSYNLVNESRTKMVENETFYLRGKLSLISSTATNNSLLGSVSINCTYEGYPAPVVEWKWIQDNDRKSEILSNPLFIIQTFASSTTGFSKISSTIHIKLAEYLGSTKFACSARNRYENSTLTYKEINENFLTIHRDNIFHLITSSSKMTYKKSQSYCKKIASNLAKIPDENTQNSLAVSVAQLKKTRRVYIGAKRHLEDGSKIWRWHDRSYLYNETKHGSWSGVSDKIVDDTYVDWEKDKPISKENCLCMKGDSWHWGGCNCSKVSKFICEKKVAGIPMFVEADVDECSSNITIKWTSSSEAVNIQHRLDVTELNPNFTTIVSENVTPNKVNEMFQKNVNQLKFWTSYRVTITVCPDMCQYPSITTRTITTYAGIPDQVSEGNVTQSNDSCMVTWATMKNIPGITGFVIHSVSTIVQDVYGTYKSRTFNENQTVTNATGSYNFETNFNRNYSFNIRARTCSGEGPSLEIDGNCVTQTGPPERIPDSIVATQPNEDNTMNISIRLPDEMNGPISCIFVITVLNPNHSKSKKIENLEELLTTMERTISELVTSEHAYIAIAISRSEINTREEHSGRQNFMLKLGDGTSSQCNSLTTQMTKRKKRDTLSTSKIQAKNTKLETEIPYGFYTLTTTPGENGIIHIKTSNISYFKISSKSDSKLYIIAIVLVILLIIIIIIVAYITFKRRCDKNHEIPGAAVSFTEVRTQSFPVADVRSEPEYENLNVDDTEPKSETDIPLTKLLDKYNSLRAEGNSQFYRQFEGLKEAAVKLEYPTRVASNVLLKRKNRYKNILPSDHSRVKLQGDEDSDYINACYINGFNKPRKYIATQGPLRSTVNDFWRMIFEQNVQIIVMLAKCNENGKKKCEKYWPHQCSSSLFGSITVSNIEEISYGFCTMRKFKVIKETEENTVHQLQFLNWPDHGIPVTTTNLTRFWEAVAKHKSSEPIVVHCSAGAGRTGSFIAYDFLLEEGRANNSVDIFKCVLGLRKQRREMVQTREQYVLIHKLLLEDYLLENTETDTRRLQMMDSNDTLEKQFENLSVIGPIIQAKNEGNQITENNGIVPFEHNRVVISRQQGDKTTPYVNASSIETYGNILKLIAARGPTESTVEYFWRAAFDNNVNTMIMLSECTEMGDLHQYWPENENTDMKVGILTIHLQTEDVEDSFVRRKMIVKGKDNEMVIIQYQHTKWGSDRCPSNASGVLEIIDKMNSSLQRDVNASVLVHCSDGSGRTGTFCAIVNLIERLKVERKIDVFRTVKDLRDCRPRMVQTLEQYKFCFKAVSEYIDMFSTYANFEKKGENQEQENLYMNV